MDPFSTLLMVAVGFSFNLDVAGRVFEVLWGLVYAYREVLVIGAMVTLLWLRWDLWVRVAVFSNRLFAYLQLSFC